MKKLILFLFAISISPLLFAQNFRIIPENTERIVLNGYDYFYAQVVESITDESNKTDLKLQGKLFENLINNAQGVQCIENEFPSELGLKITVDKLNNDQWIQLDKAGAINARIISNSNAGDTWEFVTFNGETIIATCESISQTPVNGLSDNFKTISFSAFPCKLILSENFGVIRTPDWSSFAKEENLSLIRCLERELNADVLQKFEVPFGDLASQLDPGDEIHILESNCHFTLPNCIERQIKATFLNSTYDDVTENYLLNFRHEVFQKERINHETIETTYIDTVVHNVPRFLPLGVTGEDYPLPLNKLFWVDNEGIVCNYHYFINNRTGLTFGTLSYQHSGDTIDFEICFPPYTDTGNTDTYIDGLAGPYYDYYYSQTRRLPKYYKKANEEWGDPFTFTISTSEKIISESVSIFPNPVAAGSQIYLQDLGGKEMLEIRLVDLHGRQVQSWQLLNTTNQESLQLQRNIPAGMYVLWITNNGNKQFYSKVLVK